jgi:predicted secreted protein
MLLKKVVLTISIIVLTCVSALWAGDSANFVDLGFSPDGRTYMFGQYGVLSPALRPWAEIFVVDVRANNFVQNGRISHIENIPIKAGQDGSGIFFRLINSNSSLAGRYGINFQNQGLPLYISRTEYPPENGEKIDFRDFASEKQYIAELIPTRFNSAQGVSSSFYIKLESRLPNGQTRNYTVGNPQIKRPQIASYNIKRVLIDTSGESLIFVIEMKRLAANGFDIRYMIEAQRL